MIGDDSGMIGIGDSAAKPDIGLGYQLPLLYACALSSEPMYDVPYSVVLAPEFDILSLEVSLGIFMS